MADYKLMYTKLFNATTDAINILQQVQIETENVYVEQDENNIAVLPKLDNKPEE